MRTPKLVSLAITAMTCCVVTGLLFGQSQPANFYEFVNLVAGTTFNPNTNQYTAEDFLTQWVNQHAVPITIEATLDADDNTYRYAPNCATDPYVVFPSDTMEPRSAISHNYWGVSVPWQHTKPRFVGKLRVRSLEGLTFYITSPNKWKATGSAPGSLANPECEALYAAWQNTSWRDVFYWDDPTFVLISAYGNFWHRDGFWDKGWDTVIQLSNNTPDAVGVQIVYQTDGQPPIRPVSLFPPPSCSQNLLDFFIEDTIQPGATLQTTLGFILGAPLDHTVGEDGFFRVSSSAGSGITGVYWVLPNTSGSLGCNPRGCPEGTCTQ